MLQIQWKHFDGTNINFTIKKTGTQLSIKVPNKGLEILDKYKLPKTDKNAYIFPMLPKDLNLDNPVDVDIAISSATSYINKNLKSIATKAKIEKHLSFHISRHTWATRALKKGISIDKVSKLMGHAAIKETQIYAKIVSSELDKAMDVFNDMYRNSNIKTYGSDVYAADDVSDIYDFFYDLNSQGIEILDANIDEEDYDYDSEYEKTLGENVAPNHDGKAAPYGSGYKPLEERIAKALDRINEDLCPAGKAYIKRRQAAGEKSSAYLSGRGVKVCKGQMSGRAKKKK
jgi:hypothetical protein